MFRNQSGSMVTSITMVALGLAVAAGGFFFTDSILRTSVKTAKEAGVGNISEIVMSRAGQAVAKNVILCSELYDNKCVIRSPEVAAEYGLENVRQVNQDGEDDANGKDLMVEMETCMQNTSEVEAEGGKEPEEFVCEKSGGFKVKAKVHFAFISLENLRSQSRISGMHATEDLDRHAIQTRVSIPIRKEGGEFYNVETTAALRRPRSFIRFEIVGKGCGRSCDLGDGLRDGPPCASRLLPNEVAGGGSRTEVTVLNDGPGWVYRVKVFRGFRVSDDFQGHSKADGLSEEAIEVYDSVTTDNNKIGIPPGGTVSFVDGGFPCFFDAVTVRTTGTEASVTSSITRGPLDSGSAVYSFAKAEVLQADTANLDRGLFSCGGILGIPCAYAQAPPTILEEDDSLEPANPLVVSEVGDTIPAARIVTTIVETPPPPMAVTPTPIRRRVLRRVPPSFSNDGDGDGDGN